MSPARSSRRPTTRGHRPDGADGAVLLPARLQLDRNTTTANAFGGKPPIIGLFDWRPKDIDEAVVVAESDDDGKTWYFMQTVLELNPDYTNPISGGYSAAVHQHRLPRHRHQHERQLHVGQRRRPRTTAGGTPRIIQLPGAGNATDGGQFLYLLDRNTNNIPRHATQIVDDAPLHVIHLDDVDATSSRSGTPTTRRRGNDIKSISSALIEHAPDCGPPAVVVQRPVGLLEPGRDHGRVPDAAAGGRGLARHGDVRPEDPRTATTPASTALPAAQQCNTAPFSGKTNHDISNVRLATTTDGINFTDLGIVHGLNDPTTVDYNETRWVSPRGTLLDINGDGSLWGLYFSAGNCLDGDSDAFHFIGYAESTDMMHWTVFNDINHPIASINTDHDDQPGRRRDGDHPREPAGVPHPALVRRAPLRAHGGADRLDAPEPDLRGLRRADAGERSAAITARSATWC